MIFEYKKYEAIDDFHDLFRMAILNWTDFIKNRDAYQIYVNWLYLKNPLGYPIGYNAYREGKLIGDYACIPSVWYFGDEKYRALLVLNTAVHSDFQRKGIFSELAKRIYTFAKKER